MDTEKKHELQMLANTQINLAEEYGRARVEATRAKIDLDILLVAELPHIREGRKSIGYEMSVLTLMENNTVAQNLYKVFKEQEARYKGLERLLKAHEGKSMLEMAMMKRDQTGEFTGR